VRSSSIDNDRCVGDCLLDESSMERNQNSQNQIVVLQRIRLHTDSSAGRFDCECACDEFQRWCGRLDRNMILACEATQVRSGHGVLPELLC